MCGRRRRCGAARFPRFHLVAVAPAEPDTDVDALCGPPRLSEASSRAGASKGALFTMSLPCLAESRPLGVRAATGLAQLLVLALGADAAHLVVLSPAIGERYSLVDLSVYGVCLSLGGAVFFSLALLVVHRLRRSEGFAPPHLRRRVCAGSWRDCLPASLPLFSVFQVMSAETYFRLRLEAAWFGLLPVSSALSVGAAVMARLRASSSATFSEAPPRTREQGQSRELDSPGGFWPFKTLDHAQSKGERS